MVVHHHRVGELAAQRLDLDAVSDGLKVAHRFPCLPSVLCLCCGVCTAGGPPRWFPGPCGAAAVAAEGDGFIATRAQQTGNRAADEPRGARHWGPADHPAGWPGAGRWLSELAGLVVAGWLPGDDVDPVPGVNPGDERYQRAELLVVVVLGRIRPGLAGDTPAASASRVPCSVSSSAARSASVNTFASRHAATRFSRCWLSLVCAASLVCMSMQTAQPLDLAGPDLHQFLCRSRQGRIRQRLARRDEVLGEPGRDGVAGEVETRLHGHLLVVLAVTA